MSNSRAVILMQRHQKKSVQRRDDVPNLPSLLDFYFARAVQVPLVIAFKSAEMPTDAAFPFSLYLENVDAGHEGVIK